MLLGGPPGVTELGAGNIGGMTLAPGSTNGARGSWIPTNVTLNGGATTVWILQIAQGLNMSSATVFGILTGGALAKNVFWQVAGAVVVGTTAHLEGVVLSQTSIALATGASIGRMLAQTAVTLDKNMIVEPAP